MKYKVLIKKCADPQKALAISEEIARWSGSTVDAVYNALTNKAVCIRREATEEEANSISAQFGRFGAEIDLVPVNDNAAALPSVAMSATTGLAASSAVPVSNARETGYDEDDEDDEPGRILSDAEYAEMLKQRPDVFVIEKSSRARNTEIIAVILAFAACLFMHTRTVMAIPADFFEKVIEERTVKLAEEVKATIEEKKVEEKREEVKSDQKKLTPTRSQGVSSSSGGGDPRNRVVAKGVLGILSGQIKGATTANADIFGKGGFATDIDAILSGVGGLRAGGDGGVGRKGAAGIGFGSGPNSGFGGPGGIDDLLGSLMNTGGGNLDLKQRKGELKLSSADRLSAAVLTGGRSRTSIQRVVMQNMAALRHAYNRRLREKPGLAGRITVKFAIDEFGNVLFANMVESTMSDSELEATVVERVRTWKFEKIDRPGDVTEVTYPFVFSQ